MYDERTDHRSGHSTDYPGYRGYPSHTGGYQGAGTGRHRGPAEFFTSPLEPPDAAWDPAEELAFMLQDAMEEHRPDVPVARDEAPVTEPAPNTGTPLENLQEITAELPPLKEVTRRHRKVREHKRPNVLRTTSHVIAALTAVIASSVSFFGGMVAYDPLRVVALARMQDGIASWWPLLVYGPWLVASLSVLRAALHQRRAVHSWSVVLIFSSIAMLLCVLQAPRTIVDIAAAALPGLASLACFQQFVRQITLTRPPRRTSPRHRQPRTPHTETPSMSTARDTRRATTTARPAGGTARKRA
ncbi:DUF2637 domain-containing protein [Streptomyces sp. NPDC056817]|uniref:DUF2637 domain-containing protein n=1 Tax=Streptomyces sp. NPDC056817 TaxID=3345950 RepID=UPI0036876298